jgi:hypothetical protein
MIVDGQKIPTPTMGKLPDGRSQLDLLSFGLATFHWYVGPIAT